MACTSEKNKVETPPNGPSATCGYALMTMHIMMFVKLEWYVHKLLPNEIFFSKPNAHKKV